MENNSLDSIRSTAKALLSKRNKLNVPVNNGGVIAAPYTKTTDGFESQISTNHLANFLVFVLLKDALLTSSTPKLHSSVENKYGSKGLHGLSLHPGGIWTGLQKFIPAKTMEEWKARPNMDNLMISTEQGAAKSVLVAVGQESEGKERLYW